MGKPALKVVKNETQYSGLSQGCYYVRARKNGYAVYHQAFKDSKKTDTMVDRMAYPEMGFKPEWNYEQAKARCSYLNKEKTLIHSRVREAANRSAELKSINEVLFDPHVVLQFQKRLEDENEGTERHLKKIGSHFLKIQKLCTDLKLLPSDYKDNEKLIYKWFSKNKVSLDYTQKLISLLNRWGGFSSKLQGRYFEPIKPVKGISRQNIKSAHKTVTGVRTESKPITPEMLLNKQSQLSPENFLFLKLTVWFGLRPEEARNYKSFKLQKNKTGTEFLMVYQTKLNMLDEGDRLKAIPILFKQQTECLSQLKKIFPKAPTYKTMRKVFGERYGLYAGRKGFTDLMLGEGYKLEDISLWNGHSSIETTWESYKIKNALELPTPKKSK